MNLFKLLFYLIVAALEVTLLHLGVALFTLSMGTLVSLNWPALLLVCLIAAYTTLRFEPTDSGSHFVQRPTLIVCALTALYAVKIHARGGWWPWSGWSVLWPFGDNSNVLILVGLLVCSLYAWWRGMALVDHDHAAVLRVLQRGVLVLITMSLALTPIAAVNLGAPPWGPIFAAEGILIIGLGLLGLSLARVTESAEQATGGWRRVRASAVTILGIIVLGVLALALVSSTATDVLRTILFVIGAGLALLVSPLAQLFAGRIRLNDAAMASPTPVPNASALPSAIAEPEALGNGLRALLEVFTIVLYVALLIVPLIVIGLAILLFLRRRGQREPTDGALHESLWSWRRLGDDLRGLLGNLHLPARNSGLRAALARLRQDSPVERIRRRYVEALLLGEDSDRRRRPQQTPQEYQPTLAALTPSAENAVQTLTAAYDRARYAPETVQPTDADAADAAWDQMKQHTRRS